MSQGRGYTLTDLVVTVAIAGVMTSLAVPMMRGAVQASRITTTQNELVSALWHARSEALARGQPVMVCNGRPEAGCDRDNGWEAGWYTVAVPSGVNGCRDQDADGLCDTHGSRIIRQHGPVPDDISVDGNGQLLVSRVKFQPSGLARGYAGTLSICDRTDNNIAGSGVVITVTGTVRRAQPNDLNC